MAQRRLNPEIAKQLGLKVKTPDRTTLQFGNPQYYLTKSKLKKLNELNKCWADTKTYRINNFIAEKIGITIIQLKNGKEFIIEDNYIKNQEETLTEKIAKSLCYKEL